MQREEADQLAAWRNAHDPLRARLEFYAFDSAGGLSEDGWDVTIRLRRGPDATIVAAGAPAAPAAPRAIAAPARAPAPRAPAPARSSAAPTPAPRRSEPRRLPWATLSWVALTLTGGLAVGTMAAADPRLAIAAAIAVPSLAVVLVRPDWLPAALVATVFLGGITVGTVQISRVAALVAVVVVLVRLVTGGPLAPLPLKRIQVAVGAYVAWAFASVLWSAHPDASFASGAGTGDALAGLSIALVYMFACALLIERAEDIRRLVIAFWLLSSVVGAVAVVEYMLGHGRSVGFSGDANFFAVLQVVAIPIGVALAISIRARPAIRALVLAGVAASVASVLTSLSRGGLLALCGVGLLLLLQPARGFFRSRAVKRTVLIAATLGAATLLSLAYADISRDLSRRTASIFDAKDTAAGRKFLWRAAVTGWREHPVRGIGYGAFQPESTGLLRRTPGVNLRTYRLRTEGTVVHNAYLSALAELGLVGLVLFLGILAAAISTLRRIARRAEADREPYLGTLARASILSLTGFAVASVFLSSDTSRALWLLLGVALALPRFVPSLASSASFAEPTPDRALLASRTVSPGRLTSPLTR